MACLRTAGLRLLRATWISMGTPSPSGSCCKANTAFFFTSVSGSLSIAPEIAPTAFLPAFCASQKSASDLNALAIGKLLQGEHGLLLHFGVRIVIDRARNRAHGFLAGFLREPEKRLPAHV